MESLQNTTKLKVGIRNSYLSSKEKIKSLRSLMSKNKIGAYLIPRADCFQGEFISENDNRLKWLTSFSGSAGLCIVTMKSMALFVDGRYTIQAELEKNNPQILIKKLEKKTIHDWLKKNIFVFNKIGFDPWLHTINEINDHKNEFKGIYKLKKVENLIDKLWVDKPKEKIKQVFELPEKYSGKSYLSKLGELDNLKNKIKADYIIYTLPESISWLSNIRGFDIPNTPSVKSYAIQGKNCNLEIFVIKEKLSEILIKSFETNINFFNIKLFSKKLKKLKGKIWLDGNNCPAAVANLLSSKKAKILNKADPVLFRKSIKNRVEIQNSKIAHRKDGLAMINLLYWLEKNKRSKLSEIDIIETISNFRKRSKNYFGPSFDTICGSGPNGAIIHYKANLKSNRIIRSGDLILIDSGGQYLEGTTDITRTIGYGKIDYLKRKHYTLVLKGMIAVSKLKWPIGLSGKDLDSIARYNLWQENLDYEHGTGHGVGSFLSVHEGPQAISKRNEEELKPGMIVSNEPGYYENGKFGIRIENLIRVKKSKKGFFFNNLTMAPIDKSLINKASLKKNEIKWLNNYHREVFNNLKKFMSKSEFSDLKQACSKI